jgi:hypothetical protein
MTFHRNKQDAQERKRWRAFCVTNQDLIESIGLPLSVVETHERFEDLLMHGYLDHHADPTKFSISELNAVQVEKFKAFIDRYFAAGYFDPGLMAVSNEERKALAKKYPKQFNSSLRTVEE